MIVKGLVGGTGRPSDCLLPPCSHLLLGACQLQKVSCFLRSGILLRWDHRHPQMGQLSTSWSLPFFSTSAKFKSKEPFRTGIEVVLLQEEEVGDR